MGWNWKKKLDKKLLKCRQKLDQLSPFLGGGQTYKNRVLGHILRADFGESVSVSELCECLKSIDESNFHACLTTFLLVYKNTKIVLVNLSS